jgi:methionyl-tRNA formyltransferase
MTTIALMANKIVGYKIAEYLINQNEDIKYLFLPGLDSSSEKRIADLFNKNQIKIFQGERVHDQDEVFNEVGDVDYIITVFWPYILKKDILNIAKKGTINFHPALLPKNRGWYPHVFSFIDNSPAGVSIHQIDEGIDTGAVWAQKEVEIEETDTSYELYEKLQHEIAQLFFTNWPKIKNDLITPKPTNLSDGNYNSIHRVDQYDELYLDQEYKLKDILNILKARSFGNKGFAFYKKNNEKFFLNLSVSKTNNFDKS